MSNTVQIQAIGTDIMEIRIRGFLDTVIVYHLREKVDALIHDSTCKYIINLQQLEQISSAGIGFFSNMALELRKCNGKMVFINVPHQIRQLFEMTRLVELFTIRNTMKEALSILTSPPE